MTGADIHHARSALFVPGNRPDRFGRAVDSGTDLVVLDLEDSVPEFGKAGARESVLAALDHPRTNLSAAVRVNARHRGGDLDIGMLSALRTSNPHRLRAVLIPKAEVDADIDEVSAALPGVPVIPIIETARGLAAAASLARAECVVRLAFGALDYAVDVSSTGSIMLDYARCSIVVASRLARLAAPLDSPQPEFRDLDLVSAGAMAARALGFGGQLCIHPAQIPVVASAFLPTHAEIDWAHRVLTIGEDGLGQVDGTMVDKPVLARARTILGLAGNSPAFEDRW